MSQAGRGHRSDTINYWATRCLAHIGEGKELSPRSTLEMGYREQSDESDLTVDKPDNVSGSPSRWVFILYCLPWVPPQPQK